MQKFIIKLIIFSIPIIILYNVPKFAHYSFNSEIDKKINSLIENVNEPMIIVGGDSRAERQIIPSILESRLGIETVNIGINAGDITILYNALMAHNIVNKNNSLIISISSVETNDSVVDKWGIPHACVTNISTYDNIKLFGYRYLNMMHERMRLILIELFKIHKNIKLESSDRRLLTKGFWGIGKDSTNINFKEIDVLADTSKVVWYLQSKHDGIRQDVFKKMIKKIADTDMNVIVYNPPVSPSWLERTTDTYIDSIEINHSKFLKGISAKYDNISFIDFYTNKNNTFDNNMFYNSTHFDFAGAEIFTNVLLDSLILRKLINK
ncbi:hypothetical protein ACFL3O_00615 [Candidatus Neomarinimicrobiota bacterium]